MFMTHYWAGLKFSDLVPISWLELATSVACMLNQLDRWLLG